MKRWWFNDLTFLAFLPLLLELDYLRSLFPFSSSKVRPFSISLYVHELSLALSLDNLTLRIIFATNECLRLDFAYIKASFLLL